MRPVLSLKRARRWAPPPGPPYELFDCSVLLVCLAIVGYVLNAPQQAADVALSALLDFFPHQVWGAALAVIGFAGVVASYCPRWIRLGCAALVVGCSFWSLIFALGILFGDAPARNITSVLIYAWIARRVAREGWPT